MGSAVEVNDQLLSFPVEDIVKNAREKNKDRAGIKGVWFKTLNPQMNSQ